MTEHLSECPILKPCCGDQEFPEHGFCGNFVGGRCLHCMAECICDALRACEDRVRKDEQSHFLTRYLLGRNGGGYQRGLDAAREAVDRLASEMANWSSAETVAATGAVPDLTADQWMWAQRGVWRALAAIDALKESK